MSLKEDIIQKIRNNKKCKNRLALELDKDSTTIIRWLNNNDTNLTKYQALLIISEELGLEVNSLVTTGEAVNQ